MSSSKEFNVWVFCLMLAMTGALFVINGLLDLVAAGLIGGVGAGLAYTMVRNRLNGVRRSVTVFCFSAFSFADGP